MFYPDSLIEEIMISNDILDVVSGCVHLTKKGSTYFGLCPFHNEKSASFSVSPNKQMYYCFGCGSGGNVITFVMKYENYNFTEAVKFLSERAGITLPEENFSDEAKRQADIKSILYEINKEAAKYFYVQLKSERGELAYKYLKNRELTDETIVKFGLGFSNKFSDDIYRYLKSKNYSDEILNQTGLISIKENGTYDKFWNRIMFPIMNSNNKVIAFGGRVMGEGDPKYLNSPETKIFDKSRNLYGLNFARQSRENFIIVCEGYMDVITMHQAGFTNAVASLGTAFTVGQASLLKRFTNEVLLAYDMDTAGEKAILRAIPLLKEAGLGVKIIDMSPFKDPDEFIKANGVEALKERISRAENSFLYEINVLRNSYDMNDPAGETDFQKEIATKLLEFEDALERGNYLDAVAKKFSIPAKKLESLVNKFALSHDGVKKYDKPRSAINSKREKLDLAREPERILLTWLIEEKEIYEVIKEIISEEDFVEPLSKKVADILFEQIRSGKVTPAKIINYFETEEEQKDAALLLNAEIKFETKDDKERALRDVIIKIKEKSLDSAYEKALGPEELLRNRNEKSKLKKLYISLG